MKKFSTWPEQELDRLYLQVLLQQKEKTTLVEFYLNVRSTRNKAAHKALSVFKVLCFLLYINELLETTSNPIYSFADDSTLISCMEPGKPLTSQEITRRRHHHASQVNADIKKIVEWGLVNKVQFNVQKTQATTLTKKSLAGLPTVEMEGSPLVESPSIKLLGISINNNMSWHDHKLGVLFRCRKLYTPEQLLLPYKAQIRPSLEYCSHVWGCAPKHSLKLLDSIQNRAVKLIDTDNLTKDLQSLDHRRRVAGLSLFYRFYHGRCSSELSQIITPKTVRTRNTRDALHAHPYQVEVPTPRTSLLQHSFFWKTSTLWNELPGSLFPDGYNLQRFKTNAVTDWKCKVKAKAAKLRQTSSKTGEALQQP
nr:unnamed protein product [Callosobruchus analis]